MRIEIPVWALTTAAILIIYALVLYYTFSTGNVMLLLAYTFIIIALTLVLDE